MAESSEPFIRSREEIVENFRSLVNIGMIDYCEPITASDTKFQLVQEVDFQYELWLEQEFAAAVAQGTIEALLMYNLSTLTVEFDAGFTKDQNYLDEIIWILGQDMKKAHRESLWNLIEQIDQMRRKIIQTRRINFPNTDPVVDIDLCTNQTSEIAEIVTQIEKLHGDESRDSNLAPQKL